MNTKEYINEIESKGYFIHKDGYIINRFGRKLYGSLTSKGYLRVLINGKQQRVHRSVAMKYIANPNNYDQVNHIDANKTNNAFTNLEWCNNEMNIMHSYKMGLSKSKIEVLDLQTGIIFDSIYSVAKSFPNIRYKSIVYGLRIKKNSTFKKRYVALR